MSLLLTPHVIRVKVWPKMKGRGAFRVLCSAFCVLLFGCGHGGNLLPDSQNNPSASATPSVSKSNDSQLENFVEQIYSTEYQGYLIAQVSSESLLEGVTAKPLFGESAKQVKNWMRQLEKASGKKLKSDLSAFYRIDEKDKAKAEEILRKLWKGSGVKSVYPYMKSIPFGI
ncbi:MAG: hypothetical protein Q8P84_08840 [Deltaproteobacteria bacterium]|nr:hypothetical protein [Deltaproteobacteria bacterium]